MGDVFEIENFGKKCLQEILKSIIILCSKNFTIASFQISALDCNHKFTIKFLSYILYIGAANGAL
jgi:hypothetical protein